MALRAAAAAMARSASGFAPNAPGVFVRGFAGAVERFSGGQPVQTKRPAYDERDTPHTDKWLEVRAQPPREHTARPPPRTRATPPHTFPHPAIGARASRPTPLHPTRPRAPRGKPSRAHLISSRRDDDADPPHIRGADLPPPVSRPFPSQADVPPPMELIAQVPPIAIHADRVSCKSKGACMDLYGERAGLGAPNTYYQLNSTTPENPVKCKYCGLRFYGVH